ncbi:MAG TPA: hypothetical protein VK102_00785 [Sphingobacterium sp.]|nr:hypothetical protein [Sphingobacterium sp.]
MKSYVLLLGVFILAACAGNDERKDPSSTTRKDTAAEIVSDQSEAYCFLRTEGTHHSDTTFVWFTLEGDSLKGIMHWIPAEKDSRKGTLTGTVADNEIEALWVYTQEGMEDSLQVAFKVEPQQLLQKPFIVDANTGKQRTDENAAYSILYTPTACEE